MMNAMKKNTFSVFAFALVSLSGSNMQATQLEPVKDLMDHRLALEHIKKEIEGLAITPRLKKAQADFEKAVEMAIGCATQSCPFAELKAASMHSPALPEHGVPCLAPGGSQNPFLMAYSATFFELKRVISVDLSKSSTFEQGLVKAKSLFDEWQAFFQTLDAENYEIIKHKGSVDLSSLWYELSEVDKSGALHNYFFGDIADPSFLLYQMHSFTSSVSERQRFMESFFMDAVRNGYSDLLNTVLSKHPVIAFNLHDVVKCYPVGFMINILKKEREPLLKTIEVLCNYGLIDLCSLDVETKQSVLNYWGTQYDCAIKGLEDTDADARAAALVSKMAIEEVVIYIFFRAVQSKSIGGGGISLVRESQEHVYLEKILSARVGVLPPLVAGVTFIERDHDHGRGGIDADMGDDPDEL